jgi:hypothetical protein
MCRKRASPYVGWRGAAYKTTRGARLIVVAALKARAERCGLDEPRYADEQTFKVRLQIVKSGVCPKRVCPRRAVEATTRIELV